jgi:hypothetical protein
MPVDEPKPASWQFHWHESSFVTSPYLRFIHLYSHTFSFLCFRCCIEQSSQEQRNKQICSAPKLCVGSGEIDIWNGLPHISGVVRDLVELLNPNPRLEVDSSDACVWAREGAKSAKKYLLYHNNDYFWRQSKEPRFTIKSKTAPDHPSANSCCLQIELLAASICGFDFTL